jgi:putative transposase
MRGMLPRQVLPRQFYLITRRCTQRQFLLRPDRATNNAFLYCLIDAASRCEIDVLLPCVMSNHYHAVIYDRAGRYPEFIEHFHKLLARSQNALRGRWENFWSSEQTCVVKLVGREAVLDKLVYTAANPVLAHLVEGAHHWPGVNGLSALLTGRPLRATRPLHFFRPDGPMPDELEISLTIPPELGAAAAVRAELRDRVRAVELDRAAERSRTGGKIHGRRAVLAQSWRAQPETHESRRNLRPCVATRNKSTRIEALLRNRAFVVEYATLALAGEMVPLRNFQRARTGYKGSPLSRYSRRELLGRLAATQIFLVRCTGHHHGSVGCMALRCLVIAAFASLLLT